MYGVQVSEIMKRARSAGVAQGLLDEAADTDSPKAELIRLVVQVPRALLSARCAPRLCSGLHREGCGVIHLCDPCKLTACRAVLAGRVGYMAHPFL